MKRRAPQIALVALALGVAGFLVAASGVVPIRASSGHWAVTEWFLQFAKRRSVATHSLGAGGPKLDDPNLVLKGAGHYDFGCRSCHGAPGERLPRIAQAMLPVPPELGPRVREWSAAELFEIVKHGLKFTGMPAWPAPHRDDEVWAVVAFLQKLPSLDRDAYLRLVNRAPAEAAPIARLAPTTAPSSTTPSACAPCHGRDGGGRGNTFLPRLAGQRRDYLERALLAYASGRRPSGIMAPIAAGLDAATMRALADYYARLPPAAPPPRPGGEEPDLELGRTVALEGIPGRRVPACVECHGPNGRRTKDAYPDLAGQPADYLLLQLELFKHGHRGGSSYAHLMQMVAPQLEADEMRAVASFFESLRVTDDTTPRASD